MNISTETIGRVYASGRNYLNLIIGFASGIGVVSASQSKGLTDSLSEIYNGLSQVVHGATSFWQIIAVVAAPIVGPILARMASNSAKIANQAAAVQTAVKDPKTTVSTETKISILDAAAESVSLAKPIEIKDKAIAAAVPSDKVIAK
jgi:hypothetical protein